MSKELQEKHRKYLEFYDSMKNHEKEYWGIGIENESYLMFKTHVGVDKKFMQNNHKRERYSVDYWLNFKAEEIKNALQNVPDKCELPIYISGYLLQRSDIYGEPITLYTKLAEKNPKFSGTTIHQELENNEIINKLFEDKIIYDGDTIEFTTTNFYKAHVKDVVNELLDIKTTYLNQVNNFIKTHPLRENPKFIFKDELVYPPLNYGFAKFMTNMNNLAICNNGTYHINITLPTKLNKHGEIKNLTKFKNIHANAIRAIQWFEPLLIALYGSPDIFSILNPKFFGGSLRLGMSRYIGLGTFDTKEMKPGKILNDYEYVGQNHYFGKLHQESPYNPPKTIGYDINYNKFKKHGIELRIFDYFPEEYLEDIINFIILLCQHSKKVNIPCPQDSKLWCDFTISCLKNGSKTMVPYELYSTMKKLFGIENNFLEKVFMHKKDKPILHVISKLANILYKKYKTNKIPRLLSPNMKPIVFIDYNSIIKDEYMKTLKKC